MADVNNLPSAEALKLRFQTGRVPLNTDYDNLISLANIGRILAGGNLPGSGLSYDQSGKLQLNINNFHSASWDLSPSVNNKEITVNEKVGTEMSQFPKIAFLSPENGGPTVATTTLDGTTTTFSLPATKITADKVKSQITVNIIAMKNIGVGSKDYLPLEYVENDTDSWSLCLNFALNTTTEDLSNCTLSIAPLRLAVYKINDFTSIPPQGTFQGFITVHFTYNSVRQIIPKGLIQMYSGSVAPKGWAICDGNNGTPDLRDKFIVMEGDKFTGSSEGSTSFDTAVVSGHVTVGTTKLTYAQIPSHTHTSFAMPTAAHLISGSESYQVWRSEMDNTGYTGGGEGHTHSATFSSPSHTHTVGELIPPYYALLFIMKL